MKEQQAPKYKILMEEILSWIVTGQFKPHDKLPSENEIGARFGMSRQTVRQALGDLEQEGWLYREQGKGTFVSGQTQSERRGAPQGMTIGMITTYISDYIFPTIVRGVESRLRERGARLLLASTDNEKEKEKQSLESMLREPLAGLLIEPTRSAEGNPNFHLFLALDTLGIPYVMLNERYSDVDAPCIRVDDELGGYRAACHLLELGHTRIAGFFKTDDFQGVHRMKGFIRAHREHGIALQPELLLRYTTGEKESRPQQTLAELLRRAPDDRPTAVVCYNDELGVRMLDVVRSAGLTVPGQLSIVGFDDSNLATATEVKLTSLVHPKTQMGVDAVELLMGMVDRRAGFKEGRAGGRWPGAAAEGGAGDRRLREAASDIVYEPVLVIRDSTAGPFSSFDQTKKT